MITMEEIINNEVKENNYSRLLEPKTKQEKYLDNKHDAFIKALKIHEKLSTLDESDESDEKYKYLWQELIRISNEYRIRNVLKFFEII